MADTSLVFNIIAKDKTRATFDKMKGTAAVAGAAIGLALAAGAMQALEQSKVTGVLAAQLGATGPESAAIGKTAGQLYAQGFGEDMPAVANAMKSAAQQGLVDVSKIGETASKETIASLMTVSQVVGEESSRVSAAVSTMLRTGMAGSAEEAMDLLVRATQGGVNKSEDLLDTVEEYSTLFRSLGLNGPQAMGLISQALQGGARNADQAADALKEFSIRAVDGSKTTAAGFKALGMDAETAQRAMARGGDFANETLGITLDKLRAIKDPVKQNTAGVQLFGTKWEDMREALLTMDVETAAKQMDGLKGATDKAGKAIGETAGAKLEKFKRAAQQALVDKLAAAIPYIEKTFGWLSRNSGWVVPLATGLGVLAGVIYSIVLATKIWTAVQTAFNIVMMMNPVGLIVLGIMLLIGVIVLIATKTTWFQDLWHAIWGKIGDPVKKVWAWIKDNWKLLLAIITGPIGLAVYFITKHWTSIKNGASGVWKWITGKFNSLVGFFKGLPKRVTSAVSGMWNGLKSSFKSAVNWIISKWNNLSFGISGGSFLGVSYPGMSIGTPDIPYLAKGGTATQGGSAIVGERGPELLNLPAGARVTPLTPGQKWGGGGGRMVIEIRSGGSRLDDMLVEILRNAIKARGGNVQVVLGRS